jgi:hypothetical protein
MMTFFTVPRRCLDGVLGVGELAGGFDDDLRADRSPVELGRVLGGENFDLLAADGDESPSAFTFLQRPSTESYFKRCARVFVSVRSFTATNSISFGASLHGRHSGQCGRSR